MGHAEPSATERVAAFEHQQSREGRLLRYCRARSDFVLARLCVSALGSLALAVLISPQIAGLSFLLVALGEGIEFGLLALARAMSKQRPDRWSGAFVQSAGICQALLFSGSLTLIWSSGGEPVHFFVLVFAMGTILDAGLLFQLDPRVTLMRCGVYVVAILMLFAESIVVEEAWDGHLKFDIISTLLFSYMIWEFLRLSHRSKERKLHYERQIHAVLQQVDHKNRKLEESERLSRRLALVAENASDSVIISDHRGVIDWVNPGFTQNTGYSAEEAIGQGTWMLNGPKTSKETIAAIKKATRQAKPIRTEVLNRTRAGQDRWMEVSLTPVADAQGSVDCFVSVERNITQTKTRESALDEARAQAEALTEEKSRFLATMSHEIRTPMNGVLGTADLLLQTKLNGEQTALVKVLIESGDTLLSLINDILDFSKLEAGRLEIAASDFSLQDCLNGVIDLMVPLAEAKGIRLEFPATGIPDEALTGDAIRLRQILLNLVGNAIKFTQKGQVTLLVTTQVSKGVCALTCAVSDTGVGIPAERLDHIFELFSQADGSIARKFGGTGLGLSISRTLARAMGGEITVTSVIGQGSEFTLSLDIPVSEGSGKTGSIRAEVNQSVLRGLRILVAEDNRTNRFLIKKMLAEFDMMLTFAEDGQKAVQLYTALRPDAVLMDMSMPVMDGLEASQSIIESDKQLGLKTCPILALTANAYEDDRRACFAAGMTGFVTKPFKKEDLFKALAPIAAEKAADQVAAVTNQN